MNSKAVWAPIEIYVPKTSFKFVLGPPPPGGPCLTFRLMFSFFDEFWPTRESFGMARGPRFWALGVDSGPRGGAFGGDLGPPKIIKHIFVFIGAMFNLALPWCLGIDLPG
jgi:hypothetical protein